MGLSKMDEQKLRDIISSLTSATSVDLELSLQQLGIDSLKTIALLMAIETEFSLSVPDSELNPVNFASGNAVLEMIKRLKK